MDSNNLGVFSFLWMNMISTVLLAQIDTLWFIFNSIILEGGYCPLKICLCTHRAWWGIINSFEFSQKLRLPIVWNSRGLLVTCQFHRRTGKSNFRTKHIIFWHGISRSLWMSAWPRSWSRYWGPIYSVRPGTAWSRCPWGRSVGRGAWWAFISRHTGVLRAGTLPRCWSIFIKTGKNVATIWR